MPVRLALTLPFTSTHLMTQRAAYIPCPLIISIHDVSERPPRGSRIRTSLSSQTTFSPNVPRPCNFAGVPPCKVQSRYTPLGIGRTATWRRSDSELGQSGRRNLFPSKGKEHARPVLGFSIGE